MLKHRSIARIFRGIEFIGVEGVLRFFGGIVLGIFVCGIEAALGYSLQLFLLGVGLMPATTVNVPSFLQSFIGHYSLHFFCLVVIVRAALVWTQHWFNGSFGEYFKYRFRSQVIDAVYSGRCNNTAKAVLILGEYSNGASYTFSHAQSALINITTIFFTALSLVIIAPSLLLWTVLGAIAAGVPTYLYWRFVNRTGSEITQSLRVTNEHLIRSLRNLQLIKVYAMEKTERSRSERELFQINQKALKFTRTSGSLLALPQIMGVVVIVFVCSLGDFSSKLGPGKLLTCIYMTLRLFQYGANCLTSLTSAVFHLGSLWAVREWHKTYVANARKRRHLRKKLTPNKNTLLFPVRAFKSHGRIGWKVTNLNFSHFESKANVFSNLSFSIPQGSCFVITGASGSGKTTLLNLLLGILPAPKSSIHITLANEIYPIEEIKDWLLERVGYVGPDSFLIEGSIRDSLYYGLKNKPTEKELKEAMHAAECNFIERLPKGLEYQITEQGDGLSAGEKQRISLFRALLRNPEVLILDEATSNLDLETEKELIKNLKKLKTKMTIVIVTHREAILHIADHKMHLEKLSTILPRTEVA